MQVNLIGNFSFSTRPKLRKPGFLNSQAIFSLIFRLAKVCADRFYKKYRLMNASFDVFTRNCKGITELSRKYGFYIKLNMMIFKKNFCELKKVILFAHELGISEICLNSLNLVSIDPTLADYNFYKTEEFKNGLQEALQLAKTLKIFIEYPNSEKKNSFKTCPFPWSNFSITWDGYLVPCCAKPFWKQMHFGNVFEKGLKTCINDPLLITFRKASKNDTAPKFCTNCHHLV